MTMSKGLGFQVIIGKRTVNVAKIGLALALALSFAPFESFAAEQGQDGNAAAVADGASPLWQSGVTDNDVATAVEQADDAASQAGGAASSSTTQSTSALSASDATEQEPVTEIAGDTMYETAVAEAKAAYPNGTTTAVIAGPGEAWIDALSAAGLAASRGPILFTTSDSLRPSTAQALKDLGVSSVVVLGGTSAVSDEVVRELGTQGVSLEARLAGDDCYGTQMAIYNYGLEKGLWDGSLAIVATASSFGDALSASPVAFSEKAPVFLTDGSGTLPPAQKMALAQASQQGKFPSVALVGGTLSVSERTEGFVSGVCFTNGGSYRRIAGATQYETSAEVAQWAVGTWGFSWDNTAFCSGNLPYDGLAGSVLQGVSKSVLLLVSNGSEATVDVAAQNKGDIGHIRFLGGTASVSQTVRDAILDRLSIRIYPDGVSVDQVAISQSAMADLEYAASQQVAGLNYTYDDIAQALDPAQYAYDDDGFYQFAVLDAGYSGKVSADQLNAFIATYGSRGALAGQGQAFIDAARTYGVNEVYLLCHAILESGWGTSTLAQGWTFSTDILNEDGSVQYEADGKTYYNFYGIGAYDSSPLSGGRLLAYQEGWDTPEKAIEGAAKWIATNYFSDTWNQDTLYKMRWNYPQAVSSTSVWHQYATSKTWASGIAAVMGDFYRFADIGKAGSGLSFVVPRYQ